MTDMIIAQAEPALVAIDISKARHEVLITVPGKKRRRRLTILNQLEDFNRLIAALYAYGRPVRIAFEATGNYHRALTYHLAAAGFEMKLVSSVAMARTREALHNSSKGCTHILRLCAHYGGIFCTYWFPVPSQLLLVQVEQMCFSDVKFI